MFELLLSPGGSLKDEEPGTTIFLYDPETNTDLAGSGATITLIGAAVQDNTVINGHKSLAIPTTGSGMRAVFAAPLNLQGVNWTLEWSFYNTSSAASYAPELTINSSTAGTGILSRWGDAGFGNRLQLGGRFSTAPECWSPPVLKSTSLNNEVNMALSCKDGVVHVFRNGIKVAIANGTSGTYNYLTYPVGTNLSNLINLTAGYIGSGSATQTGYRGRIRLSLGGRYTRNYPLVPLEL
jgi:hypothetical protein